MQTVALSSLEPGRSNPRKAMDRNGFASPNLPSWIVSIARRALCLSANSQNSIVELLWWRSPGSTGRINIRRSRRRDEAWRAPGLSRRRIVRRLPRRHYLVQYDPGRVRRRQRGRSGVFHLRPAASRRRRREHRPLIKRKARPAELLSGVAPPLHYSEYHRGQGPAFHEQACRLQLEGVVSKRADAAYTPGNPGLWLKVKCLHR